MTQLDTPPTTTPGAFPPDGSSPAAPGGSSPDLARIKYGAALIVAAFVLLGVVFGISVTHFTAAADVAATVGSVAAVIGTIVGAFFGVQAGSSGKEAAETARSQAESRTQVALAAMTPEQAAAVLPQIHAS